MIALVLLLQVFGSRLEARTPAVNKVLEEFRREWEVARATVAPGVDAVLEFPEYQLKVGNSVVPARTFWSGFVFYTEADWRKIYSASEELRAHIAIHEACHLTAADRLQGGDLSQWERNRLEMDAETCYVAYRASQSFNEDLR